jgi:hypothetical protein
MRHWFFVLTGFLVSVATVSGAAATTPAFEQGRADRQAVETWFAGLNGDFRAGADYWAAHRSKPAALFLLRCRPYGRFRLGM